VAYGIKLHCWGEWACFTRPEMKVERVSYDVMTRGGRGLKPLGSRVAGLS